MTDDHTPQPPDRETVVELSDGRTMGTAEWGPEDGTAIFWFHGTPGARRQVPPQARARAARDNVRIIGLERPGVGSSTAHLYPSLTAFAADIDEVADRRRVERYGAIGLSGGGPYVLACAHEHSERMIAGAALGGVAPVSGAQAASGGPLSAARLLNPLIRALHEPLGAGLSAVVRALHPVSHTAIELYAKVGPGADARVLRVPHMREMFIDDLVEGSRTQLRSIVYDMILFTQEWDLELSAIDVPVRFYQGDDDFYVPLSHGAHMASMLPNGSLEYRPGTGHLDGFDAADAAMDFIAGHGGASAKSGSARRRGSKRTSTSSGRSTSTTASTTAKAKAKAKAKRGTSTPASATSATPKKAAPAASKRPKATSTTTAAPKAARTA